MPASLRLFAPIATIATAFGLSACGGGQAGDEPARDVAQATSTSAQRGLCESLKASGVTPGLYGLCVAYCEALNCPDTTAGVERPAAVCEAPDPGILRSYNKKKSQTDPTMPCVQQNLCPCWNAEELAGVGFSFTPHSLELFWNRSVDIEALRLAENRVATDDSPYGGFTSVSVDDTNTADNCTYFYADLAPNAPSPIIRVQDITQAQADMCKAQIEQQLRTVEDAGTIVTCSGNVCASRSSGTLTHEAPPALKRFMR
jgi:hypothetical protein